MDKKTFIAIISTGVIVLIICLSVIFFLNSRNHDGNSAGNNGQPNNTTQTDDAAQSASKTDTVKNEDSDETKTLKTAYMGYLGLLEDNQYDISSYTTQRNKLGDFINQQVALCDINDDGIPELFTIVAESSYEAKLHIYSYVENRVKELIYQNTSEPYEVSTKFSIVDAAAGTDFMIFKSKEKENFYICSVKGDETLYYCINEYRFDGYGIERLKCVENVVCYSSEDQSDTYYKNDNEISHNSGIAEFASARENVKDVIVYSGNQSDMSMWKKINPSRVLAKSCEQMISVLREKIAR